MIGTVILVAVLCGLSAASVIGPTFGYGYLPGEGFFCKADTGGKGTVVLNHTNRPESTHAVLTHFWVTGEGYPTDRLWVSYYLDGELEPSISFQPSMACGVAFPQLYDPTALFSAGSLCGKNAHTGGFWHTFPIPFAKSVVVTALPDPQDGDCVWGYMNIRGTENLPLILPGSSVPLPASARMHVQNNKWSLHQPLEYISLFHASLGQSGLVFQTSFAVENKPVGGVEKGGGYIEGCFQLYPSDDTPFPGVVVGTGVEDYFDSAYYFGAAFGGSAQTFTGEQSGLPFFSRENTSGYERFSAYRFHLRDPLAFNGGGRLVWKVGGSDDAKKRITKCGEPYPKLKGAVHRPLRSSSSVLSPINMSSSVWFFTWPKSVDGMVV